MQDYIHYIRSMVGHKKIILNFAGGVIIKDGKILLQKRTDSLKWGLPGGAVELGESYQDAARREILEETGLNVSITDLQGIYSDPSYVAEYPNGDQAQTIVASFYCEVLSETELFDKNETVECRYFPFSDLPPLHNQQHIDIVADVMTNKRYHFN